jgi:hypothetical protein
MRHIPWPPSVFTVTLVLAIGAVLLLSAIAVRRSGRSLLASAILSVAALWNAAIVVAFMSPRNRHVFHLATHRSSVIVNAAIGIAWLAVCVLCTLKWYRRR